MNHCSLLFVCGFVFAVLPVAGCSKHDCALEGKQAHYWQDLAPTTKGAKLCIAGEEPNGCKLDGARCVPTLDAVHSKQTQEQLESHYKDALEKQGWKYVGQTTKADKSKSMAFKKADDELVVAFGTSQLSEAMGEGSGVDVFMMRKPDGAPGTMLDGYKAD